MSWTNLKDPIYVYHWKAYPEDADFKTYSTYKRAYDAATEYLRKHNAGRPPIAWLPYAGYIVKESLDIYFEHLRAWGQRIETSTHVEWGKFKK